MNNVLKVHDVQLITESPVHIGDGTKIEKKQYIYDPIAQKVKIVDLNCLYNHFHSIGRETAFTEFLLNRNKSLQNLVIEFNLNIDKFVKYELDCSPLPGSDFKLREIISFTKDPYGYPYIPGSSLKGMLRSALIAYKISCDQHLLNSLKVQIEQDLESGTKGRSCLKKSAKSIESVFDKKINDKESLKLMSGLIVSDSRPIMDDAPLVLAQKIDYTLKGKENALPIYKESLKPGIKVDFTVTIDTSVLNIDVNYIRNALDFYQKMAFQYYYQKFGRGDTSSGTSWLGGGAGFTSKTLIYQMFMQDAPLITDQIFYKTLGNNYEKHHHDEYKRIITPHICKCTFYNGKLYDMGKCKINFIN